MKTGKSLSIFALLFLSIAVIFLGCGGGGGGGGNQIVTLEKSSGTAASALKVSGLDIEACPLSTSEIRVGGQTAPALLNDKGEVVMMLPLFYDEATKWAAPPSEPQDVEIYCNGTLLTTLPEAVTVTELQPAPGTTEDIIADFTQIIADFQEIFAVLAPDPGIQQQLLTSLITAIEELLSGTSANSLPAIISGLTQDNPEVLALLDAIHAASGVDGAMASFKELMAALKNDSVTALSLSPAQAPAASALSANTSPPGQFTSSSASRAPTFTIETPKQLPDEALAEQMQLYRTLNLFSEQVLSDTEATFSRIAGLASIISNKIPYVDKVAVILKLTTYAFKTLLLSPFPAILESIELTLPKTTLENSEITNSFFIVKAKNIPAPVTLTDLFDLTITALGIVGGGDKAQAWVNTFKGALEQYILFLTGEIDKLLKSIPDFPYDVDVFTIIPQMYFEALGYTRELYTLYPLEGGQDIEVIQPLTDQLEWQADDTHWGKAKVFLETVPLAFGDEMAISNKMSVTVGELTLVPEYSFITIPEGESKSVGVKLSNQPPEDQPIVVIAQRTSGDSDISVTSGQSMVFDHLNWDDYRDIVLAAAEDDEDIVDGQATITVRADIDDYGDETITIIEEITAVEEDNDEEDDDNVNFLTNISVVTVPEGGSASFQVKLNREIDFSIDATVLHESGDADIIITSNPLLQFNPSNWNTYQTVTLYAQPDEDTDNGTAQIKISANAPDVEDMFITALENDIDEISEISLAIQGSEFGGIMGSRNWNGVVPLTIEPESGCIETVKGTGPLEFVGFDYWYQSGTDGPMCHFYESGFIDVNVDGIKDCGNPPGYTLTIELIINVTKYTTCSDGSSWSSQQTGPWKSYAVALDPQNGYIETYADVIDSYRVELLQP